MDENDQQQTEELEVLASIYPAECEVVSADARPRVLKIHLVPHAPGGDENHVAIALVATLPPEYPSSAAPQIGIEIEKGLGQKQRDELKVIAENTANVDIGMPTIFSICEALKEWLCDNNVPGQDGSMYSEMLRREQKKDTDLKRKEEKKAISMAADFELAEKIIDPEEEERIRKRQAGQPVTVESFNAWKAKFEEEMRIQTAMFSGEKVGTGVVSTEVRLTGKQLFLLNKVGASDGDDLADEEALFDETAENPELIGKILSFNDYDEDEDEDEDYVPGDDEDEDEDDYGDSESEEA